MWAMMVAALMAWSLAIVVPAQAAGTDDTVEKAWQALQAGGHVALMRHATAPGTGDPPSFKLGDCSTQRTLSASGREEARRIGAAFRERGVVVEGVWSSEWCRCLETAELLGLGPPTPLPALNSFFEDPGAEAERTAVVRSFIAEPSSGTRVLVSHQVNITALTGIFPRSGETVVVRSLAEDGALAVVSRIPPP